MTRLATTAVQLGLLGALWFVAPIVLRAVRDIIGGDQ